jgi:DNA polymerase III delta subunit
MQTIMDKIKQSENIVVDADAEKFILTLCKNNIKVLINYLEKFKLFNQPINLSLANKLCCNINFNDLANYTVCLLNNQLVPAINIIYTIFDKGYSVMDILDSYFIFVKTTELLNEQLKYKTIPFICKYITIFYNIHEDELELALFTNNLLELLTDKL